MLEKMDSLVDRANGTAAAAARSACFEPRRPTAEPRPMTPDELTRIMRDAERLQEVWGTSNDYENHKGPVPPLDVILRSEILPAFCLLPADADRLVANAQREERRREDARLQKGLAEFGKAVGARFAAATIDGYQVTTPEQREVVKAIRGYIGDLKARVAAGNGLILFGAAGTGKTHLLCAVGKSAIGAGLSVGWVNGQDVFASFRAAIDGDGSEAKIVRALVAPDVLVLDDVLPPAGVLTDYQASTLYRIIEARYRQCRPTWVSMNAAGGEEAERGMGAQVVDRLRDGALCLFCNWPSYRKARG